MPASTGLRLGVESGSSEGWIRPDVQVEARVVFKSWLMESPGYSQGLDQVGVRADGCADEVRIRLRLKLNKAEEHLNGNTAMGSRL